MKAIPLLSKCKDDKFIQTNRFNVLQICTNYHQKL